MHVYIIEASGYFKVGLANNVSARKKALQTSNPHTLKVRYYVKLRSRADAKKVEAMMHKRFKKFQKRGEWFSANIEDLINGLIECSDQFEVVAAKKRKVQQQKTAAKAVVFREFRKETYDFIKKETSNFITIDKHNILCLLTKGVGLPRHIRGLFGVPKNPAKGWKRNIIGTQMARADFLANCDPSLK